MTLESLHDDHTARFASRAPFATTTSSGNAAVRHRRTALIARPFIADPTWEN